MTFSIRYIAPRSNDI